MPWQERLWAASGLKSLAEDFLLEAGSVPRPFLTLTSQTWAQSPGRL